MGIVPLNNNKIFALFVVVILGLQFLVVLTSKAPISEVMGLNNQSSSIKDDGTTIANDLDSTDAVIPGSPRKRILTFFNLTYAGEPIGRANVYSDDMIRLQNGSYAMLVWCFDEQIHYLGISPDGWQWDSFHQLLFREDEIMRSVKLFQLENGTLGVICLYYDRMGRQGLYYRLVQPSGRLGPLYTILTPFEASISTNFKLVRHVNGTYSVILYNYNKLFLLTSQNFPFSWGQLRELDASSYLASQAIPVQYRNKTNIDDDFDVVLTPTNKLVYAGIEWGENWSTYVFLMVWDFTTGKWSGFQILPFVSPYPYYYIKLQLLSSGVLAAIARERDYRMHLSFGIAPRTWTDPVPLVELYGEYQEHLDESKAPFLCELPNQALLFVQTRRALMDHVLTPYIEIRIVPNHPYLFEHPLLLGGPPAAQEVDHGNGTASLRWNAWDADPATYTVYRDGLEVQHGTWSNTAPIMYTASTSELTLDRNYTLVVADQAGHRVAHQWGEYTIPPVPETFPVLAHPASILSPEGILAVLLLLLAIVGLVYVSRMN